METFTIKVQMQKRWIPHFLGMLKYMQLLGGIGASRELTFYADGDGDFRPKFEFDVNIKPVNHELRINGEERINDRLFDAG